MLPKKESDLFHRTTEFIEFESTLMDGLDPN
jgi:hypothetical protein